MSATLTTPRASSYLFDDLSQLEMPMIEGLPRLPFDMSKGQPILGLRVDDHQVLATMTVGQLLTVVPDPRASEDPKRVANDPTLQAYAEIRHEVQRMVQGAKAKNAQLYGKYIVRGLRDDVPWITPPMTLYHPGPLEVVELAHGLVVLMLPYGHFLTAIDGETQRIAWQNAAQEYPKAMGATVKTVIHHGISLEAARQSFYDLNTREVKPNAAVAIAMDTQDVATHITRRLMEESEVLRDGKVNLQRRQLRRSDPELMTISALRTGVVTTILGAPGLQIGSRPITDLPEGTDLQQLQEAVVGVWTPILELIEEELQRDRRAESVASAPAILAGIGVVAHHAMPKPPRRDGVVGWTAEEVADHLEGINWSRAYTPKTEAEGVTIERPDGVTVLVGSVWDGIAGKFTPSGRFAIGGPKEVGYAVAEALEDPESRSGQRIREVK